MIRGLQPASQKITEAFWMIKHNQIKFIEKQETLLPKHARNRICRRN